MQPRQIEYKDLITGILLSVFLCVFRLAIQSIVSVNEGQGWDGTFYYRMALGNLAEAELPFRLRVGVPLLVQLIPKLDVLLRFQIVNLTFAFLFSVVCYVGICQFSSLLSTRITTWLLICGTEISPVAETAWYPAQTDAASNFFLILVLLICLSRNQRPISLLILFALGTLIRENFPIFISLICFQLTIAPARSQVRVLVNSLKCNVTSLLNLVGATLGSIIGMAGITFISGVSPLDGKSNTFFSVLNSHLLINTLAAGINVYGSLGLFILASIINKPEGRRMVRDTMSVLMVLPLLTAISLGGGSNTERFLFWGLVVLAFQSIPSMDNFFRRTGWPIKFLAVMSMLAFQRFLLPISTGGMAGCDVNSYFKGPSTFMGHWTQICGINYSVSLVGFYLAFVTVFVALVLLDSNTIHGEGPAGTQKKFIGLAR